MAVDPDPPDPAPSSLLQFLSLSLVCCEQRSSSVALSIFSSSVCLSVCLPTVRDRIIGAMDAADADDARTTNQPEDADRVYLVPYGWVPFRSIHNLLPLLLPRLEYGLLFLDLVTCFFWKCMFVIRDLWSRWWREAQEPLPSQQQEEGTAPVGDVARGIPYSASPAPSPYGGPMKLINNIFNSDLIFNLCRNDDLAQDAGEGVSGRTYALIPPDMWAQTIGWFVDYFSSFSSTRIT